MKLNKDIKMNSWEDFFFRGLGVGGVCDTDEMTMLESCFMCRSNSVSYEMFIGLTSFLRKFT